MAEPPPRRVEDYTTTCLVLWGVNLFNALFALWALFGLAPVLLLALALNRAITLVARQRAAG